MLHKLKMKFKKPRTVELLKIDTEKCVGCGKCVEMCKRKVFGMSDKRAIVANRDACVGCGKCVEKMCRFSAIKLIVQQN